MHILVTHNYVGFSTYSTAKTLVTKISSEQQKFGSRVRKTVPRCHPIALAWMNLAQQFMANGGKVDAAFLQAAAGQLFKMFG